MEETKYFLLGFVCEQEKMVVEQHADHCHYAPKPGSCRCYLRIGVDTGDTLRIPLTVLEMQMLFFGLDGVLRGMQVAKVEVPA
jgi:hypothetical protein